LANAVAPFFEEFLGCFLPQLTNFLTVHLLWRLLQVLARLSYRGQERVSFYATPIGFYQS
ncbi:MAG: hypothetical protein ACUVV0_17275, partial [Anaerolineae bacterium]